MSLVEPDFRTALAAHYSAVHARLWGRPMPRRPTPRPHLPAPQAVPLPAPVPTSVLGLHDTAAKWREIDMLVFGGHVSPKSIIAVTASYFELDAKLLISKDRTRAVARARHCAMYVMQRLCHNPLIYSGCVNDDTCLSLNLISRQFGRHHATAFHSIQKTKERMSQDPAVARAVADIVELLKR